MKHSPPTEPRIGGEEEFLPNNNRIYHHYCRVLWDQVYGVTKMDEAFTLMGVSASVMGVILEEKKNNQNTKANHQAR